MTRRVRYSMAPTASCRYKAEVANAAGEIGAVVRPVAPRAASTPSSRGSGTRHSSGCASPRPAIATEPEDYYERLRGSLAGPPPNYQAACTVLEAAAADMMTFAGASSDTPYE
jgi:hypothetical protein